MVPGNKMLNLLNNAILLSFTAEIGNENIAGDCESESSGDEGFPGLFDD